MLTLQRLRNPSDEVLANLDLAEVDSVCAEGLPGSERLDISAALSWVNHAADWSRQQTLATYQNFASDPAAYDHSEGIFRVVAMMGVLWRGMSVHYNQERIDNPEEFTDSRDDFIHGIIEGRGGTCASLPVLFAAVGRRLGYPLKLVKTACHLYCRWDDSLGERFNIEINNTGLNTHPDEHYLTWPKDIRHLNWQERHYLQSLSRREEVALAWSKRGHCRHANGYLREAVDCFATACSIETDNRELDMCLFALVKEWRESMSPKIPSDTPRLTIYFPRVRRYPGLPIEMERKVIELEVLEGLLKNPIPNVKHVVRCVLA